MPKHGVPRCEMCGSEIVTAHWSTRRFCGDCRRVRQIEWSRRYRAKGVRP